MGCWRNEKRSDCREQQKSGGAGAVECVTSLASLHHESGYSAFVLHSLSKTTRKQQQSLLPEYERINLLPMLNIYLSLFSFYSLALYAP